MRTDGQADMTKLVVALRDIANAPNGQPAARRQTSDALIPPSMETARGVTGPLYNVLLRKQSSKNAQCVCALTHSGTSLPTSTSVL